MDATRETLLERVNHIRWRVQERITPEAQTLIDRHIALIRPVVRFIVQRTGKPVAAAHGDALTPASDTVEYERVLNALFDEGEFYAAGVREPLILTLTANEVWQLDSELKTFANPWQPLVDLAVLGYPTSYADAPDLSSVDLIVGLRDGTQTIPVV